MTMRIATLLALALALGGPAAAATLSGRVTDGAGRGVYPCDLDLFVTATGLPVALSGDTTGPTGHYTVTVPAGTHDIRFTPAAGSHLFTSLHPAMNTSVPLTIDATLPRGHYLTGQVTGGGTPIGFADLDLRAPVTGEVPVNLQGDLTDASGFFTVLVDSAVWDVSVIAPLAARRVPRVLTGVDARADVALGTIALDPGHLVTGSVTDLGFFPLGGMDLDARPVGGGPKAFTPQDDTAPDGSYALVLAPGVYDLSAGPAGNEPYAPATARSVPVFSDVDAGNLALPPGFQLRATCVGSGGGAIAGVDVDADSLPGSRRLELQNDLSDATGKVRTLLSTGDFRITLVPPVAARSLPVRFDSLRIVGPRDLGTVTFPAGRWVTGTVTESGTGTPIAGADLDFTLLATGVTALTPGDDSDAAGAFRVTLADGIYRVRVVPPGAAHDTLTLAAVHVGADTALALALPVRTLAVGGPGDAAAVALAAPWPNPARDGVTLSFATAGEAELTVWDVTGRRVATVFNGRPGGQRVARWDTRDERGSAVPPGVYLVRLRGADGAALARRVAVTR